MISPALDPGSTTVEVWLKIDNKSGRLKVGAPVKVSITGKTVAQAWKVPTPPMLTADDGTKSVMVVGSDGAAHRKPVTLGIDDGRDVQVLSGLAPADLVITGGAYGLDEGTKVKIGPAAGGDAGAAEGTTDARRSSRSTQRPTQSPSGWPGPRAPSSSLPLVLTVAGIYLAFQVPISVFPETNFPRVIIGVDNGVMPVEQMEVTITQPIENAVNSVPGLGDRALHHQPRLGRGGPVLQLERGHGPLAAIGGFGACQGAADAAPHGAHHHQPAHLRHLSRSSATASPPTPCRRRGSGRSPPTI